MIPLWNPITGETPIDDISGLIPKGLKTRAQLNFVEAENMLKATIRYLASRPTRRQAPFTLEWCYKLHRQMFGDVWRWAGRKRTTKLNIGVPAHRIDVDLKSLMDDLAIWRKNNEMDMIEQAARLHHRAVFIHPFLNGNGRWSRMLANIYLKQSKSPITKWPESDISGVSPIRQEYLEAIRAADDGNYSALIGLHTRYSERLMSA